MAQARPDQFSKGKELNILLLATGPSVFYNMDKVKSYIREVNPVIVSINGYLHGIRYLGGKRHKTVLPNKTKKTIDMKDIRMLIPDIHFSFLKFAERTSPKTAIKGKDRKHNLFQHFIEDHKRFMLKHNISLMYPGASSTKVGTRFGFPSWKKRCHAFDFYPKKCKTKRQKTKFPLKIGKMFKDGHICFRAEHGGEYVLAWALSHGPHTLAMCGFLDYPLRDIATMRRGWFWIDSRRNMPPKMSRNQSQIVAYAKKKYGKRFVDLNVTPWK